MPLKPIRQCNAQWHSPIDLGSFADHKRNTWHNSLNISDIHIVNLYYDFAARFLVLFIMKTIFSLVRKLNTYMRYGQILIISSDNLVNMV